MSSVLMIRRGAGGSVSGAYAVLSVTCPVGSLCTVRREGVVYQDPRREGVAFFALPGAGDWAVTITDGEREKSVSVPVTERGQVVRLLLLYAGTSLFAPDSGTESLWQSSGMGGVSSESIALQANPRCIQSFAHLKEPVSMAGMTRLAVSLRQTVLPISAGGQEDATPATIYIIPEDTAPTDLAHAVKALSVGAGDFTGEDACSIDISDLEHSRRYYVTLRAHIYWGSGESEQVAACSVTVTDVAMM